MSAQTIRTALGRLQDDPDLESAWHELQDAVTAPDPGLEVAELTSLLAAARAAHARRGEWEAVAHLLELEIVMGSGTPNEATLQAELARVLEDELLEEGQAVQAYRRLIEIEPGNEVANEAIARAEAARGKWSELAESYAARVAGTPDAAERSALLVRAAEAAWRFGRRQQGAVAGAVERLGEALSLDPHNRRAALLLERIYRVEARWTDAAALLERVGTEAATDEDRVAAFVRLARLFLRRLTSPERATAAYERVLDLAPGHEEALSFLSEFFSSREQWDYLVALYEDQLRAGGVPVEQEAGIVLQIAMVHWRARGRPEAAEPWFERLRRLEPAHPGVLAFFREWCAAKKDRVRLLGVLGDAQRALADGPERAALSSEMARLAEGDANPAKAIEQYRAVLRQDASNREARDALKRLYTQTEAWNSLVELLRQELERVPTDDRAGRLAALRELTEVYRAHVKSDTALVTVLTQLVQLDPSDVASVRDLVRVYEALSRWRDLLVYQQKLAELTEDRAQKIEIYRSVARRWLDQFSNVQNAIDAYEALLDVDPADREARTRLRELYTKRRAWPQLFSLAERELSDADGPMRLELLIEMAKLAAERLDRGADAVALYKRALAEHEGAPGVLDALERQAEREKDYATVAEVLERRVGLAEGDAARSTVLQKLGSVYADRIGDPIGAARAWRRVLELQPGHPKALRVLRDTYLATNDLESLERLYAEQNDWEGLADVLSAAADRTTDPGLKVDYSVRTARVFEGRLGQPERAFRSYERVLSVHPDDARAARALVPIYEREERWVRLPALYEILLAHATSGDEKVALYRKLADTAGQRLQDKSAALAYARRAYDADPAAEGALGFLERASRAAGSWDTFIEALETRLAAPGLGAADARSLRSKLAEIYASEKGDVDRAVATYRALVEDDPRDEATVVALDRLLRAGDRRDELRWLFETRATHADEVGKVTLLDEWAALEEDAFGEPARAVVLYRRVLESAPDDGRALAALPPLLIAAGEAAEAAEVTSRRRDLSEGAARAERELELAALYLDSLARPEDALGAAERALALSTHEPRAVALLERLLDGPKTRARAAADLRREYAGIGDARREAHALGVMLDEATDPAERLALVNASADVYEHKLGAAGTGLDVVLKGAAEFPTDIALWDRASSLAAAAGRPTELASALRDALRAGLPPEVEVELCERAASLHDDKLNDPESAVPYLERVLAREPTNERAFTRLKQILTSTERWAQLEALYERVTSATNDPERKVELYTEVALVCEEITGENAKAIEYYERIVAIEPGNEQAMRSLDALYQAEKRPRELAGLLDRRLAGASGAGATTLKRRLGRIYLDDLHEPPRALMHLEEVLRDEADDDEARRLVERLLDVGSLRTRAAEVLEAVYDARGEVRDLVRVLGVRLESAGNDDMRRELLRRVAHLRDERLQDDAGSLDALARLVPLEPGDVASRTRLQEIGRRLGAGGRVAEVLLTAAEAASTKEQRAEILLEVARLYEDDLGDRASAEASYRRVVGLDRNDPALVLPAARALERIYAAGGDHRALAETLALEVGLESDAQARAELYARLGELQETVLDDPAAAVLAWRARLDDDPHDERALGALERLYERVGSWRELVVTLHAREGVAVGAEERRRLMTKAADVLASKLGDTTEAVAAWRAVVDEFGPDRATLAALAALYERAADWHELARTLDDDLSLADEPHERLALYARLGDVRREHLNDLPGAIEAYRQALTLDPSHPASRAALERLLERGASKREAAEILRPLYETDGDNEKLLRVLDIESEAAEAPAERLAIYEQATRVAEGPLADPARAFGYATRAAREASGDPSFAAWVERLETLAQGTGRYDELVRVLSALTADVVDDETQLALTLRVADLARERLADRELARDWYKKALDLRGNDRRALVALEQIYAELDDHRALFETIKRRVESAEGDDERRELLYRQARLARDVLADPAQAIAIFESVLDLSLDPPAVGALEGLYASSGRHEDLVRLYDRLIAERPADEADLHVKLARVARRDRHDIDRAFEELEAALALDPQHAGAVELLEGLLDAADAPEHQARAGEMLEPVYLRRADWKRVMATLHARLAASHDPDERRALLKRLAQLHEEQEEDYRAALDVTARILHENLTDEDVWAEAERLAKVAGAEARLGEIYATELAAVDHDEAPTARLARRTGQIFADLGDLERALAFYRRALAFEPDSRELFERVDGLLVKAARPAERVELHRAALDHRYDPAERLATLHTIADLEENALIEPAKAVETYRAALDVDERDRIALDALTRLYRAAERWRDLAELYTRRIDVEPDPEHAAPHRLALSRLAKDQLGDVGAAVDQLEALVGELPWHQEAIAELETLTADDSVKGRVVEILRPLYERADDWRDLIRLNGQRLTLASEPSERVAIYRENARLYETRANDREKAFSAARSAFELDPGDGETRAELDRLAASLSAWDALADSYEKAIGASEGQTKRELLASLAEVHDKRRDDPRRALDAYQRLAAVDDVDPDPLDAIDQLSLLLSDWPALVRVLTKKTELAGADDERAGLWRRVGEVRRDMLEQSADAVDAFDRALELDPGDVSTVDALLALHEEKGESTRLVELYRRRVELTAGADNDLTYDLLMRAAGRYEDPLGQRREAIDALRDALDVRPGDRTALRALDRLLRAEAMWPDLLENLRLEASTAETLDERVTLRRTMGDLYREQLAEPHEALECYRAVLDESPGDDASVAAVRRLGGEHEELRAAAADVLEPVLRTSRRWGDLVAALEMRLGSQTDQGERARTLRAIATVEESELGRPAAALDVLLRALAETPDDAELHAEIERIAYLADGFGSYADALSSQAGATLDSLVAKDLYTRLGRVAEEKLVDHPRAIKAYRAAVEQAGDTPDLLASLDRLYERTGDPGALADVLERRVVVEDDPIARADHLYRLARLQMADDPEKALVTLRQCLDVRPDHPGAREALVELLDHGALFDEASETLETVYRAQNDHERLAALFGRRIARATSPHDRVRLRLDLARVFEDLGHDSKRAQLVVEQALSDEAADPDVLAELERLAPVNEDFASAAGALERAVAAATDLTPDVARDLYVRLAGWYQHRLSDPTSAERAFERALEKEPESLDILQSLETLRRVPGRERELVETLCRRARVEVELDRKRELLREAKSVADAPLADRDLAEAVLRQMLDEHEVDTWALSELTLSREAAGDWAEATTLLLRSAEAAPSPGDAAALKLRAARARREHLGDVKGAVGLYEELFEHDPHDRASSDALRTLYLETGQHRELSRLLEDLIGQATGPAERTALRLELARLQSEVLGSPSDAVDTLRSVLEEEPGQPEAVVRLSRIYEQTNKDEELAELLNAQIDLAGERRDSGAELRFRMRLGEVYEGRLADPTKAFAAYDAVIERDPTNLDALRAVARLAEARDDHARAARTLEILVTLEGGETLVADALRLAAAYGKLANDEGARGALERALAVDPTNPEVRPALRTIYERTGDYAKLADLTAGDADLAPDDASRIRLLRQAAQIQRERRDDAAAAATLLERAAALAPDDRELLFALCDAYSASGRGRDAAQVLEKIIASYGGKRSKELAAVHHRLATAYLVEGDKTRALAELDAAFKIDPGSIVILKDLGSLTMEVGDLERAQKTFRALLLQKLDAGAPISKAEVFYNLGEILRRQGDKTKAIQMLERAVENDASLQRARDLIAELKAT